MANDLNDQHTDGLSDSLHSQEPTTSPSNEEKQARQSEADALDNHLENTVERNLSLLRQMVAEQSARLDEVPLIPTPSKEAITPLPDLPEDEPDLGATRVFADQLLPEPETDHPLASPELDGKTMVMEVPLSTLEGSADLATDQGRGDEEEDMAPKVKKASRKATHSKQAKREKKKQERTSRKIAMTVIVVILLAIALAGAWGWNYVSSSLGPVDRNATSYVQVEIPSGSSTSEIGRILEEKGLIKNAQIFSLYARLRSYNNFQSGYYNLRQSMSVDEIAHALQDMGSETASEPVQGRVRVIEGYTIDQISDAISDNVMTEDTSDKSPFTKEDFLKTVQDATFIQRMQEKYPQLLASLPAEDSGVKYRLEGYLYPATYDYHDGDTMESVVEQMIATLNTYLQDYYGQIETSGYSVNEILTLASLVEKEGVRDEDRRNIASVFYNRLNAGMPLQSNVALHYAAGDLGQTTNLADDATVDTNMDSPYNIYLNTGLMPGPVDSPSIDAIRWTIQPNTTDYYYFVADMQSENRDIYFARTLEEHNQNVEAHVNAHLNTSSSSSN